MSALIAVPARDVEPGDRIDQTSLTVESVTTAGNRQQYLICRSTGGAPVVREYDPGEIVSVLR